MARSKTTFQKGIAPGRPKGAASVRTREVANALAKDGKITPLDVMVETMRELWSAAEGIADVGERRTMRISACAIAEKAAPYMHSKLHATDVSVRQIRDAADLSDAEILSILATAGVAAEDDGAEASNPIH